MTTLNPLLEQLRHALHDDPSEESWGALCDLLDRWPVADAPVALAYAQAHLSAWPEALRAPPASWRDAYLNQAPPPWWALVQAYDLLLLDPGPNKIACIKKIRAIRGVGLLASKRLAEELPSRIVRAEGRRVAQDAAQKLTELGAAVELVATTTRLRRPDLEVGAGLQAPGRDLSATDLSRLDLSRADLQGANLTGASLQGAQLVHTDLTGARLIRADLSDAQLPHARLQGARMSLARLGDADLQGADLTDAALHHVAAPRARLRGACLRGASLSDSDLRGADLGEANLAGVTFTRADLRGSDLRGAQLPDPSASPRPFLDARYDRQTRWPDGFNPTTSGAIGPGARVTSRSLSLRDLSGQDLSGADLSHTSLMDANLRGADLSGASLEGAYMNSADLHGADLTSANLFRACYDKATRWPDGFDPTTRGAIGPGAQLAGASLRDQHLSWIDLSGADLSGADLRGAELRGADLSGATLTGARYNAATEWPHGFDAAEAGAVLDPN